MENGLDVPLSGSGTSRRARRHTHPWTLVLCVYLAYNLPGLIDMPWSKVDGYDKHLCWNLFGLGLLIHHHGMLQRFVDLGNLFDVWFIGAAVIALQRLLPFNKKDSISIALLWWTMLQVFRLGSAFLFQQAAG